MDFADVLNAIADLMDGYNYKIESLESFPDLKGFSKQDTGSEILPIEYVSQTGCGDYGFHGTIYYKTTYSNGDGGFMFIRVDYSD